MKTKKELRDEYKLTKLRVGVFQILFLKENKIYLQTTSDLDKAFNSALFQLNAALHLNKDLQNDWTTFGSESFEFKILDELQSDEPITPHQQRIDVKELLEIYKNEMNSNGQLLY